MGNIQRIAVPSRAVVVFASAATASRNVAGLPAAARAVRKAALAGVAECWLIAGPRWNPDERLRAEVYRLAGSMPVHFPAGAQLPANFTGEPAIWLEGERIVGAASVGDALGGRVPAGQANFDPESGAAVLDEAARRIVADTAKPSDGIVSRTINRPISQAISRQLLRWPAIRPIHATGVTVLLAVAMMCCLLAGGRTGLIAGALLFQAASIFDGVDGEIARATLRTSRFGAMADSLVDAATNIGFIGGVVINLWIAGHRDVAMAGAAGLATMALGLFVIGRRAGSGGGPFTFNGVKDRICAGGSRIMQWLTWLTMRDFYALAAVLFVVSGFTDAGLVAFAAIAVGWLAVVLFVMALPGRRTA